VELHNGARARDATTEVGEFLFEDAEIGRGDGVVLLNDDVAGAEEAQGFAEGKMHVEGDGRLSAVGFRVNGFEIGGAEGVVPDGRGGIAGVAGAGAVVAGEEVLGDAQLVFNVRQSWIREGHDQIPCSDGSDGHGMPCPFSGFVWQSLLAGLDEELGVFHGRLRQDAMAEVEDVAGTGEGGDDFLGGAANFGWRAEEDRGIEVALQGDVRAELCAERAKINAPIDAEDVGAGTRNGGKEMVRSFGVVNDGSSSSDSGDDFLRGGQREGFVIGEGELAAPGVEELHCGGARSDLRFEIGDGGLRDAVEKFAERSGLAAQESFDGGESVAGAAFDHIAGERPRGGGEAENRDGRAELAGYAADGFGQEGGFEFGVEDSEFGDVGGGTYRLGEIGAGVTELELQAHGFGRDENVGENDNGINAEAAEGLEGDLGGEVGSFADFEKRMIGANGAVFGKVAASLAHHPDRNMREGFAAAGAEKQLFAIERGFRGHRVPRQKDNKSPQRLQGRDGSVAGRGEHGGASRNGAPTAESLAAARREKQGSFCYTSR